MTGLLGSVEGPADLRRLTTPELQRLAQEVRELVIDTIGEVGGHFGANLGACEIAVALHSLLDSPRDQIVWDTGHQAYPHKVLTGRRRRLDTIRSHGGLAPFCSRSESEHDVMGAGHASTALSYAVGIKQAMLLGLREDARVVAVVGDGALTGGVALEALHNAGGLELPVVIVLNDNGMSIAPNVGALSRLLQRIRLDPEAPGAGPASAHRAPGRWFEALGVAYLGPVDGHDVRALRDAVVAALESARPVVVHARTVKGRGFAAAEQGGPEAMERWHAARPGSVLGGAPAARRARSSGRPPYSAVFGRALVRECRRDPRVLGITAAMSSGTGLDLLQRELPHRCFDVGIAEQHAVLFAAGLALRGAKPVVAVYSTFLQRAYDQIVHDVCLQRLNVVFALDRAGLVGEDGPTHHGAFDISYQRCLPNIVLMAPRDEAMLVRMLRTALLYDDGPIALRYPRGAGEGVEPPARPEPIEIGRGELLRPAREGARVALLGYGHGVGLALRAARRLADEHALPATVADARFAKPLDTELVARLAAEHELLVTVEENALAGGFGSAVLEFLADRGLLHRRSVLRLGLPDRFVAHGDPARLREEVGLTPEAVARRVAEAVLAPTGTLAA